MSLQFSTPAEAFMATAVVMLSVDGAGSMAERKYLLDNVRTLPEFQGVSVEAFDALCSAVTDQVYGALPMGDMGIAPEGIDTLAAAVRAILTPDQRHGALKMAAGLCAADGSSAAEQAILAQLEQGLAG